MNDLVSLEATRLLSLPVRKLDREAKMANIEALPSSKIQASERSLSDVFNAKFNFRIPDYQRPYSWGKEQAAELLADIQDAAERSPEEPYFLGSIVLVKSSESPDADVIDGQQRLTTLTILFAMLRELTEDYGLSINLQALIVELGNIALGLEQKPRLTIRSRDSELFEQLIQRSGGKAAIESIDEGILATDAQRAFVGNARYFLDQLAYLSEQQRLELIRHLLTKTFLVVVSTADLSSAHRIFSVMNARGLDLTPADLFKAEIIGKIDNDVQDIYAKKWEDAEEQLGRQGFAELFLHLRMIIAKVRGQRELLVEFRDQVLNPHLKDHSAAHFVDTVLMPYAGAYSQVKDASFASTKGADEINAWLTRLAQLDNNDWVPPAVWALKVHGNDPVWLAQFFAKLERLAASMLIRRVYSTPRAQRYGELLKQLDRGNGLQSPAFDLSDAERSETLNGLNGPVYQHKRVVKYVLLRLDETLSDSSGVTYQHKYISVEHVLPQTPPEGSSWLHTFTDDERALWTHRLGNLVLLNRVKNSEASNRDFSYKKKSYFSGKNGVANYALTSQVLQHYEWTPEVLVTTQRDRLNILAEVWNLGTYRIPVSNEEWVA